MTSHIQRIGSLFGLLLIVSSSLLAQEPPARGAGGMRGSSLRGTVYDPQGRPQPNVSVSLSGGRRGGGGGLRRGGLRGVAGPVAVTDANGVYEFRDLPPADYTLEPNMQQAPSRSVPELTGVVRRRVAVKESQDRIADLGGTQKLTGSLLVNDTPLANGLLMISGTLPRSPVFIAIAETDEQGRFTFFGIPPGRRSLYFSRAKAGPDWRHVADLDVLSEGGDLGAFRLRTGSVTMELMGAMMEGEFNLGLERKVDGAGAVSDAQSSGPPQGNWKLREYKDLPFGRYEARVQNRALLTWRKDLDLNAAQPDVSLKIDFPAGTARLEGAVEGGPPSMPGFELWSADRSLVKTIEIRSVNAASVGLIEQNSLPPGEYFLRALGSVDSPPIERVQLVNGETREIRITNEKLLPFGKESGLVSVEVRNQEGDPFPCDIKLLGPAGEAKPQFIQDGRATFASPAGSYRLVVSFPGFVTVDRTVQALVLLPGGRNDPNSQIDVTMVPEPR